MHVRGRQPPVHVLARAVHVRRLRVHPMRQGGGGRTIALHVDAVVAALQTSHADSPVADRARYRRLGRRLPAPAARRARRMRLIK